MMSGEMIDDAAERAVQNKALLRRLLMDIDKHLLFKLMHHMSLGSSEKKVKESMEAIGCKYPAD